MGVFKNEVGRPSNETIKKRKIIKVLCLIIFIVVIITISILLKNKVIDQKKESNINKDKKDSLPNGWYYHNQYGACNTSFDCFSMELTEYDKSENKWNKISDESVVFYEEFYFYKNHDLHYYVKTAYGEYVDTFIWKSEKDKIIVGRKDINVNTGYEGFEKLFELYYRNNNLTYVKKLSSNEEVTRSLNKLNKNEQFSGFDKNISAVPVKIDRKIIKYFNEKEKSALSLKKQIQLFQDNYNMAFDMYTKDDFYYFAYDNLSIIDRFKVKKEKDGNLSYYIGDKKVAYDDENNYYDTINYGGNILVGSIHSVNENIKYNSNEFFNVLIYDYKGNLIYSLMDDLTKKGIYDSNNIKTTIIMDEDSTYNDDQIKFYVDDVLYSLDLNNTKISKLK